MNSCNEERKMKKLKFWSCLAALIILIIIFVPVLTFIFNGRVVGEIKGNTLYYDGDTYVETYEAVNIDVGRCLGTVTWDDGSTNKIYKLKGYPDYIYLSMFLDHSVYKKSSESEVKAVKTYQPFSPAPTPNRH